MKKYIGLIALLFGGCGCPGCDVVLPAITTDTVAAVLAIIDLVTAFLA